jgi:amino acid transporter
MGWALKKKLSRDLGLFSVVSISTGAMVGAGIFVLPSIALAEAGPGAILSFIFSGIIAFLSALAVCELATGMPKAGGSYYFLSRAMGSRIGAIAGWGSWIALIFKGAFALLGFAFYLSLFLPNPVEARLIAFILTMILMSVNIVGTKRAGTFQSILLVGTLSLIALLIVTGVLKVDTSHFEDFLPHGSWSVLSTASLIFVSYIGIVKVSAVSEEIKDPGKNIPRGIIISSLLVIALYTLVVYVLAGLFEPEDLKDLYTPIAEAGRVAMGDMGFLIMGVAGVLATASMANAAIISSSRYPFAMSRDRMVPDILIKVNPRFNTPHASILLTCGFLGAIVIFLDIQVIVEVASAFNIIIFILLNMALMIMRRAKPSWYKPKFRVPAVPLIPIVAIVGCMLILFNYPLWLLAAATFFIFLGIGWHYLYSRKRVRLRGAVRDAALKTVKARAIEKTVTAIAKEQRERVLVLITNPEHEITMLDLANAIFSDEDKANMLFVRLKVFPSSTPLFVKKGYVDPKDRAFEDKVMEHAKRLDLTIEPIEVITHSVEHSIISLSEEYRIDTIFLDWDKEFESHMLRESYIDWLFHESPCDVLVFKNNGLEKVEKILVPATTEGPFDDVKVGLVNSLMSTMKARVTFLRVIPPDTHSEKIKIIKDYLERMDNVIPIPTRVQIRYNKSVEKAIIEASGDYDILVLGVTGERVFKEVVFGSVADHVAAKARCSVLVFHRSARPKSKILERAMTRIAR